MVIVGMPLVSIPLLFSNQLKYRLKNEAYVISCQTGPKCVKQQYQCRWCELFKL